MSTKSVLSRQPVVLLPEPNQVVLCNAVPITVKTSPDDAVLCITIVDEDNNALSTTHQGQSVGGIYATNVDFGPLANGAAYIRVCYAIGGRCSNGEQNCVFIPIVIQCSTSTTRVVKHVAKSDKFSDGKLILSANRVQRRRR